MDEQNQAQQAPEGTIAITSVAQFGQLIGNWHHNVMSQLQHCAEVPDGESLTIQLEEGAEPEELVLTGDALKGFKAAMIVSMNIAHKLPFAGVARDDDAAPQGD